MTVKLETTSNLYNQDYQAWLIKTIEQLRAKNFNNVDWEILIEELESLVRSDRRELQNRLRVLLMHLLKHQYQPEKRTGSWVSTIVEQHRQIVLLLKNSPSLKPYYLEIFVDCYTDAVKDASDETKLAVKSFPVESPFLPEDVINRDFISSVINQEEV
ncbi:MAG TPA: DUF29 domain-containing protein [Oculatellaceae cyanobacterium]|jgi:hypothetical protein